jgi:hypothetical protein
MLCTPGKEHNIPLQLEDDNLPGYQQRQADFKELIGEIIDDIRSSILSVLPKDSDKITGKQGAVNARNAIRDIDTSGNPSPYLHPERYPK